MVIRACPGAHAGAFDDAGVDGVPQLDADGPQAVGVEHAGHPGAEHLAGVVGRQHRAVALRAVVEQLVVAGRFAEAEVGVGVDQAGHDRAPARVDPLVHAARLGLGQRLGAQGGDPVAAHQHRLVGSRRGAGAVDDGASGDQDAVGHRLSSDLVMRQKVNYYEPSWLDWPGGDRNSSRSPR
ncbi:hypothetical protein ACFQE7_00055 [Nonomuraea ferruginea]|uniref:hypothetical protein n=1 Tax=Nonomuraea ferruginea TaxID=46174 RepID=UPI00361B1F53